jgi:hypothetical protein
VVGWEPDSVIANSKAAHAQILQLSARAFARLLRLYPRAYRQEFGPHMAQLFKDCSLEAVGQGGGTALLELWISTFLDVVKTAFEEHYKEFFSMTKQKAIGYAGWALLLGGLLLLAVFASSDMEASFMDPLGGPDAAIEYFKLVGGVLAMLGLAAGAWFVRSAYGHLPGSVGKLALFASAAAAVVSAIGVIGMSLQPNGSGTWWGFFFLGLVICATGFGLFGIASLQSKVLPGLSWLFALSLVIPVTSFGLTGIDNQLGIWLLGAGLVSLAAAGAWMLRGTATAKAGN